MSGLASHTHNVTSLKLTDKKKNIFDVISYEKVSYHFVKICLTCIIFRVAVSRSKDVPPFGPNIPVGAKFGKQRAFADFLLTKGDGKFCMSAILDFFISSGNQCFVLNLEEILNKQKQYSKVLAMCHLSFLSHILALIFSDRVIYM